MPIVVEKDIRPTVVIQPDMRFATTFLSTKYRDYAVPGEALMDKASGELFFKRPTDGRVISFFQNKKFIHDMCLELRVMLVNNPDLTYPEENDAAYFACENYDVVAMNNEGLYDLVEDDIVIQNEPDSINEFRFHVSGKSNGFFIRVTTRDVDKPVVEYITNEYNRTFKNYTGHVAKYLEEAGKFTSEDRWEDSNATVWYNLRVEATGDTQIYRNLHGNVRVNESTAVLFPNQVNVDFPDGVSYYEIQIQKIEFHKIHMMLSDMDVYGEDFVRGYKKLRFDDYRIEPAEMNVMHFVDNVDQIDILGNETRLAFMDMPYINRYMRKMNQLVNLNAVILSVARPNSTVWLKNTVWAEKMSIIAPYDKAVATGADSEMSDLALKYSGGDILVKRTEFSMDSSETSNFFIDENAAVVYDG